LALTISDWNVHDGRSDPMRGACAGMSSPRIRVIESDFTRSGDVPFGRA
jgi:hypothetical protein